MRTLLLTLTLTLAACSGSHPPSIDVPVAPVRPFSEPSGPGTRHLLAADAVLNLPDNTLPDGEIPAQHWTLGPVSPAHRLPSTDGRADFTFDLPFPTGRMDTRFRPAGMQVFDVDGNELPFDMSPLAEAHTGWRVKDGLLVVVQSGPLDELTVSVAYSAVHDAMTRLNLSTSGLALADFATWTHTEKDVSTPGLLLPAPGTASWTVDVPRQGRFRAEPTRIETADTGASSDGAVLSLSVTADGIQTVVATRDVGVPGGWFSWLSPAADPVWRVDLADWAGQQVTLTLHTDPRANPDHDYVFVGAPTVSGAPDSAPRRVVVIAVDTLRPDHLGTFGYPRATSPELDAFAAQSVVFERAWAPAPRTRPSFRSAFTGRGALDAVGAPNVAETFQAAGFATGGIVANIHLSPRFGFDRGFDHWQLSSAVDAEPQVDAALAWLEEHRHEDSFLFLHLMDPHLFYKPPAPYDTLFIEQIDPDLPDPFNRWKALDWTTDGPIDPVRREHVTALYDGEIAYMSEHVGRLLAALDAMGPNTLVVFHTDHGEELWEHGGFEHNHALWDEVTRAALWMRPPPSMHIAPSRVDVPVTLADIAPTLLDLTGLDGPPMDGLSLGPLITGDLDGDWSRPLPIGHLMYDLEQWGVVWSDHKYVVTTSTGHEQLYDLRADPGEQTNLAQSTDLTPFQQALATAHGMRVSLGWRVEVDVRGHEDLVVTLPAKATWARVMDPEAANPSRANQVWGEVPDLFTEDVGSVRLSEDGRTLTFTPGISANGVLFVAFDAPTPAGGTAVRVDRELPDGIDDDGWWVSDPRVRLRATQSVVLDTPPDEAARLAVLSEVDGDLRSILEELGYVGGGE